MIRYLIICFTAVLLASCAQVVTPAGGPVDNIPPKVVRYIPDSAALNVKPQKIQIQFNEYIQLKELQKNLVVSPTPKTQPDITASGKTLTIKLEDTLEDNTTYIINFGRSVHKLRSFNN
jgi:hypothetical protein